MRAFHRRRRQDGGVQNKRRLSFLSAQRSPWKPRDRRQGGAFALIAASILVTLAAAFGLGALLDAPPLARFELNLRGLIAGLAATAPLVLALEWLMRSRKPRVIAFREDQIAFFAGLGFKFTPTRIAILAIGAGVSEELLFRGVLQTWADGFLPTALAVLSTNVVFGALHWRSAFYALLAGLVGAYFGLLFVLAENLLAPVVAHAAYDAFAFAYVRRAIEEPSASRGS